MMESALNARMKALSYCSYGLIPATMNCLGLSLTLIELREANVRYSKKKKKKKLARQ